MKWLQTILKEALDLFVDDRRLVLDALIGVLAAGVVQRLTGWHALSGAILVLGIVAALGFSVWQRAGRKD